MSKIDVHQRRIDGVLGNQTQRFGHGGDGSDGFRPVSLKEPLQA
ncbi:hypothetical protein [Bradyrhizobium sp. RT3a]